MMTATMTIMCMMAIQPDMHTAVYIMPRLLRGRIITHRIRTTRIIMPHLRIMAEDTTAEYTMHRQEADMVVDTTVADIIGAK